jgi:hypothetical protein
VSSCARGLSSSSLHRLTRAPGAWVLDVAASAPPPDSGRIEAPVAPTSSKIEETVVVAAVILDRCGDRHVLFTCHGRCQGVAATDNFASGAPT